MDYNNLRVRRKVYKSQIGTSLYIKNITPTELTVSKELLPSMTGRLPTNLPFKEISILPYKTKYNEFVDFKYNNTSINEFVNLFWVEYKSTIKRMWQPDTLHIILHSSGYDSRLTSQALIELKEEYGDKWLGEILFVECGGEGNEFKQIMEMQGWNNNQYTIYNNGSLISEYYKDAFDFSKAWKYLSGCCSYPVNACGLAIEWIKDKYIPGNMADSVFTDVSCIMNYGSNEVTSYMNKRWGVDYALKVHYDHTMAYISNPLCITPYYDKDLLLVIHNHGYLACYEAMQSVDGVSYIILNRLFPELLAIENIHPKKVVQRGYMRILNRLLEQVTDDYYGSWYFLNSKNEQAKPINKIEYNDFWAMWSLASYCEWLVNNGYKVRIAD